ncbi:hypothetical protein BT67DRAFT_437913 [Trichocladium antarcticum]|uniref:Uncharacterized protein n=1 Tax=Trichocladium antarcticum TaxID=1450529 RepID=A0AAN6ZIA8_9PEZI|nr:hypothetical protein BT67DRAFT_437913 [Trichocladium antarcticum]
MGRGVRSFVSCCVVGGGCFWKGRCGKSLGCFGVLYLVQSIDSLGDPVALRMVLYMDCVL